MTSDIDDNEDPMDERPQRRREWSGALRSVVLPIVVVGAIVAAIWLIEQRDSGSSDGGDTGIVQRASGVPEGQSVGAERGKVAPDFVLQTVDGSTVRLSDFAGRPVFVNFWATWCTPCRKEMPEIIDAQRRYADSGLAVIAVNAMEDRDTAAGFVREFGMEFPSALDFRGEVALAFRATGLPTSYFIDRDGVIRAVFFGPLSSEQMDEQLKKIL
jgi:thiol-disulfide isomerase/thioredoxin